MTRKTTTKKPSQLDRKKTGDKFVKDLISETFDQVQKDIEADERALPVLAQGVVDMAENVTDLCEAVRTDMKAVHAKLDLLLKGSDFMKEIGEKEDPTFRVGDWVISDSHNTAILKHGVPYKVKGIVPRGLVFDIGDHKDISYGDANFRVATPAEVQKYEEQVKAQEWAKVDELQNGDCFINSQLNRAAIHEQGLAIQSEHLSAAFDCLNWTGYEFVLHNNRLAEMKSTAELRRRLEGTIAKRKAQGQEAKKAKLKFGTRVEYEDDRGWKVAMDKPTPDGLYVIVKDGHARMAWAKDSQLTLIDP